MIGKKRKKRQSNVGRKTAKAKKICIDRKEETPEEREKRLTKKRASMSQKRYFVESEENATARRLENAIRNSNARKKESEEKVTNRRLADCFRHSVSRQNETEEDTLNNRSKDAKRQKISKNAKKTSKKKYLEEFNATVNGPLHEQNFTKENMEAFHQELALFNQQQCQICHELWPTKSLKDPNYTCDHCSKKSGAAFGIQNDIICDLSSIHWEIIKLIREMTMIEEMLLSLVLPIMTVCRLATGANISRGFVANFRQDCVTLIRKIPLLPSQVPFFTDSSHGRSKYFTVFQSIT